MAVQTFAFCARKGGVGKSVLTASIAAYLSEEKKARVLLIDCDGQGSLSSYFMKPAQLAALGIEQTTAAFFDERVPANPGAMIHKTHIPGLYLVPATDATTHYNFPDIQNRPEALRHSIRNFLRMVSDKFMLCMIDTPPVLRTLPCAAALAAANYVISPVRPAKYSAQSIAELNRFIDAAKVDNPGLHLLGYVINQKKNNWSVHKSNAERLTRLHGDLIFPQHVPELAAIEEATETSTPITQLQPKGQAADAIRTISHQVFVRFHEHATARIQRQATGQEAA